MKRAKNAKGNEEGFECRQDQLERHTFMIPKAMITLLEKLVYDSKEKTNKSKLVREALNKSYL